MAVGEPVSRSVSPSESVRYFKENHEECKELLEEIKKIETAVGSRRAKKTPEGFVRLSKTNSDTLRRLSDIAQEKMVLLDSVAQVAGERSEEREAFIRWETTIETIKERLSIIREKIGEPPPPQATPLGKQEPRGVKRAASPTVQLPEQPRHEAPAERPRELPAGVAQPAGDMQVDQGGNVSLPIQSPPEANRQGGYQQGEPQPPAKRLRREVVLPAGAFAGTMGVGVVHMGVGALAEAPVAAGIATGLVWVAPAILAAQTVRKAPKWSRRQRVAAAGTGVALATVSVVTFGAATPVAASLAATALFGGALVGAKAEESIFHFAAPPAEQALAQMERGQGQPPAAQPPADRPPAAQPQ